ncbi:MAG TPA: alpha/beta hydrolase [Candidatus Wunengus sp. YC60]|uniref:alpha/beta hydrolase n=1 Tax=Candidatus Wunengus sp. YC60 TaxID=3367697 RepID=UPI0040269A4E
MGKLLGICYTPIMSFFDIFIHNHITKRVVTNGIERKYLVGGKGTTVLLILPGSGQDALSCYDLINAFEHEYKVITVNYDQLRNLQQFYGYVNAVLKKEDTKILYIYGLSIGGFLAQHYLRQYKNTVSKIIISHAGTTKSKTIIYKVAIPGKILHFFLPIIPMALFRDTLLKIAGKVQSGQKDVKNLYLKYSTAQNLERRTELFKKTGYSFLTRDYLESIYHLGVDMERNEQKFTDTDLVDWNGKMLILRTDNDPLAQDDGIFKTYYPKAKIITFHKTGHLTPFVRFEEMTREMQKFLN